MEYIWDNYQYRRAGVTNNNKHIDTLEARHIGCVEADNPSDNCDGSKGMIDGFDSKISIQNSCALPNLFFEIA